MDAGAMPKPQAKGEQAHGAAAKAGS